MTRSAEFYESIGKPDIYSKPNSGFTAIHGPKVEITGFTRRPEYEGDDPGVAMANMSGEYNELHYPPHDKDVDITNPNSNMYASMLAKDPRFIATGDAPLWYEKYNPPTVNTLATTEDATALAHPILGRMAQHSLRMAGRLPSFDDALSRQSSRLVNNLLSRGAIEKPAWMKNSSRTYAANNWTHGTAHEMIDDAGGHTDLYNTLQDADVARQLTPEEVSEAKQTTSRIIHPARRNDSFIEAFSSASPEVPEVPTGPQPQEVPLPGF